MNRSRLTLVIAGLIVAVVGCRVPAQPAAIDTPVPPPGDGQVRGATLERIQDDPKRYYGRDVTVTGYVEEKVGTSAVSLVSSTLLDGDEVLAINVGLAVVQEAEAEQVPLEVAGEVRRFDALELERGFGFQLEEDVYAAHEGEPVIVAQSVRALTAEEALGQGEATLRLIAESPEEYADRRVAVSGAVADILADRAFALAGATHPAGEPVLMVTRSARVLDDPLEIDDLVAARGTVRRLRDGEFDADLDLDLTDAAYDGFEDGPVVVVDSAFVMSGEEAGRVRRQFAVRPANISDERMLRAVVESPDEYTERWTKVVGAVGTRLGNRGFGLEGATLPSGGELLVIDVFEEPVTALEEGVPVLVAGTVEPFAPRALGEELGLDFSEPAFEGFAGEPALVADVLRVVPDVRLRALEEAALEVIAAGPEAYAGGHATIRGTVSHVIGDQSMTLSSPGLGGGPEVLVLEVGENGAAASIERGDLLRVSGTVHRFDPAEIREAYGLDVSGDVYDRFEGFAVIAADSTAVDGDD